MQIDFAYTQLISIHQGTIHVAMLTPVSTELSFLAPAVVQSAHDTTWA